jgi:GNAT superfamily N-acetyltransferase
MSTYFEVNRGNLTISTNPTRLDLEAVCGFLSRSYWAQNRSRSTIEHSLQHSLVFGIYAGESMVGMARLITDFATFAWLCDVFIDEGYRGRRIGKWLMETIQAHPGLQGLRRWLLATRDAHGLYCQYGYATLQNPERWMEKFNPDAN